VRASDPEDGEFPAVPTTIRYVRAPAWLVGTLAGLAALGLPGGAIAGSAASHGRGHPQHLGALTQLSGLRGCLVDRSGPSLDCAKARALKGPGPFMGSRAIALSPNGRSVYVASSRSDAIAVFGRNARTGALTQSKGGAGCIRAGGAGGCAKAVGLDGPNSVAVSPDGRNVYATSRASNAITVFRRNRSTGALSQLPGGAGCVSGLAIPDCASARALVGPDVVVVSPDGKNVYVGSFFGNAVAVFGREGSTGELTQSAGASGCIAVAISGCTPGIALGAPEGMAISGNGTNVYVASALSNAVAVLVRDQSTGALTQADNGNGCIVESPIAGCASGVELNGANAVAISPNAGNVYVTSLFSNSVTSFSASSSSGTLAQKPGTTGCLVYLRAVGCSFGRALIAPEGLAVSPDGANVYAAAFTTGAIAVLDRGRRSGSVAQMPGRAGCLALRSVAGCTPARALRGVSSIALSPDGRYLYSTSFASNAVDVFRRATSQRHSRSN
jgi:DNA-binding beta-propeller fold protein YncE